MATFLLEIRAEEIPANALPGARRQLEDLFVKHLGEAGLEALTITPLSTSRRLAVVIEGLPERQADRTEDIAGPPVRVAFADDGTPTKAALGFAKKVGLPIERISRVETAKGEYLVATVVHPGRNTVDILAEITPRILGALRFPKMMRWGLGEHIFVRPVHGIVALLDETLVPVKAFGIEASRMTVGHRVHCPEDLTIGHAEDYGPTLARRSVMVDPAIRLKSLEDRAFELAANTGSLVHPDRHLVAEHVELVEWPGLIVGAIEEKFLELPPEVVVQTLRHHQKCLILENAAGALQPNFLAVIDRLDDPEGLIRLGNEWVIRARLADAEFFFNEDRKKPLASLVTGLDRVEWHRVLGSLQAKASRIAGLANMFAASLGLAIDGDRIIEAAYLVKADLLTNMVGEFPELQGVMGGHYLRLEGADEDLWTAARDHYLPIGFEGRIPESDLGRLLGLADRLDTIAGLYSVGEKPTGSKDPLGLRRAAQGAVKIIAEAGWSVDIEKAVHQAVAGVAGVATEKDVAAAIHDFLADRVRRWLTDAGGVAGDTADAVMEAGWNHLPETVARAAALEEVRANASFRALSLAFKRVRNITDGQAPGKIDPALFEHKAETDLHDRITDFHNALETLLPEYRVCEAFKAMEPIAETLDQFFVDVLVMARDERVRANRIALLTRLGEDFLTLADLSKLQIEGGRS